VHGPSAQLGRTRLGPQYPGNCACSPFLLTSPRSQVNPNSYEPCSASSVLRTQACIIPRCFPLSLRLRALLPSPNCAYRLEIIDRHLYSGALKLSVQAMPKHRSWPSRPPFAFQSLILAAISSDDARLGLFPSHGTRCMRCPLNQDSLGDRGVTESRHRGAGNSEW
jgi:hypothetical protein